MKNKRILSRALALALTLSILPTPAMAASLGSGFEKDTASANSYVYMELVKRLKELATRGGSTADIAVELTDKKVAYTANEKNEITSVNGLDGKLVVDALMSDLPYHLYWFKKTSSEASPGGYKIGMSTTGPNYLDKISFSFAVTSDCTTTSLYALDFNAADSAESARKKADAIAAEADKKGSDYEKLQYCFDEIKKLASYNHAAADNSNTPYGTPWQMTSVFDGTVENDNGTNPVCEGYAKAFKYLCDGLGIDCYLVSGTMNSGDHMWNIVTLEGKNYLVDVTNCDESAEANTISIGWPDLLFLKGYKSHPSDNTYIFDGVNKDITFIYDNNTVELFQSVGMSNILNISSEDYKPGEAAPDDGNSGSTPSSYTITFNAGNGGSGEMTSASAGFSYKLPECVFTAPVGYEFAGWHVQGNKFDVIIQPGIEIAPSSNLTLTAIWEKISSEEPVETYTVTFDSDGGTAVQSQTVEKNGKVTKPAEPTKAGYRFDAWYDKNGLSSEFDFGKPITADITLTAKWTKIHTVTFSDGITSKPAVVEVANGETAEEPVAPTRDGYYFEGWFCNGERFDFDAAVTADTALTAKWTKIHTVTFDFNGIAGNYSVSVADGCVVGVNVKEATREGYEFAGWYLNDKPFDLALTAITADTTLTARWMKDGVLVSVYTVSFDTGVYGLNIAPQKVEDGSAVEKPADPVRTGYTFLHWLLGSVEYDFAAPVTGSMTLTALWEQNFVPAPDYDDDDHDYVDMTGGGSGSSGDSGSSSTTTEKNPDGSTTTTKTDKNGTTTETTKHTDGSATTVKTEKDGTVTTTEKDARGNQTVTVEKSDGSVVFTAVQKDGTQSAASVDAAGTVTAEVEVSKKAVQEAAKSGEAVQLPIPAVTSEKGGNASTVTVELPKNSGKVDVVIPVAEVTPGTVAVIVHPDGTEEVVIQSKLTENGLGLTLEGGATLKIVDNSKDFDDVKPNDWFSNATDFVSSRNLFAGTSETEFSPNAPMTMEMLFAVAHNFMGKPETTASGVAGAKPEDWFHTASNWAAEMGLTSGLKMDMLGTNQPISREDTAILLFNLSGKAASYAPSAETLAKLNAFTDIADMDPANRTALAWAVENGIMNGMGDGTFGFKGNNTRAQTGAVMMNFNNNL